LDSQFRQGRFHILQLEWFDDGFNFFHVRLVLFFFTDTNSRGISVNRIFPETGEHKKAKPLPITSPAEKIRTNPPLMKRL
jgi:hypothetical protein